MRTRMAKGAEPAVVTMNQIEVIAACQQYLKSKGFRLGNTCALRLGMGKTPKVEFQAEFTFHPEKKTHNKKKIPVKVPAPVRKK